MAKLQMCRICLFENVHMYVVANKNLQDTYLKLTDVPFVTEDSRPMLACSFCYTKLKQCCQLQRKCLEAEKLFTQMLNSCELQAVTDRSHTECSSGFVTTSIEIISIVDDGQSEEEMPAVSARQHDVLGIKEEHHSHDFGSENNYPGEVYVESRPPQHPASDSEDDVPLVGIKTEVKTVKEETVDLSKKQFGGKDTKIMASRHPETGLPEVVHIPSYQPRSHLEDNVPLMEIKAEVEEVVEKGEELSEKKLKAKKAKRVPVSKKSKLKDDTSTGKQKKNGRSKLMSNQTTQIRTSASHTKPKDPIFNTKLVQTSSDSVFNLSIYNLINNAIDTNFGSKNVGGKILNTKNIKSDNLNTLNVQEDSFKCDVCDVSFKDKCNLRRHVITHGVAPFKCNLCERGFHAKSHLAKHHRTHTGERPFECDQCHRCFSERSNLIKHLRRHTGDKPYKCDVCQRSFNQKYHLQSHSLVHTGEKPFKCDVCEQGFNRLYNFKQHYRTHTGEKPHECIICCKTFTHKTSLTNHMRNHTGEKPFKCFVCQRCFTHKQSLDMHFRKHTGEKPYKCDVCQKCFTQGSHLKQHLARNHNADKS